MQDSSRFYNRVVSRNPQETDQSIILFTFDCN